MKLRLLLVVPLLCLAGCTSSSSSPRGPRTPVLSPPASPAITAPAAGPSGCGHVYPAGSPLPEWTASATPPTGLQWTLGDDGNMVGILFGSPFQAGSRADGKSNKILFISRVARNGATLEITATSGAASVKASQPADSAPGEIYPSIVDVPAPGCWHLALSWGPNTDTMDLFYGS